MWYRSELVTKIKEDKEGKYLVTACCSVIRNKNIKTIIIHEQMEQMAYKVGE